MHLRKFLMVLKAGKDSGVASYGALGHVPSQDLEKINLTVNISKITKGKHVLHFRLSDQKHAKTHINRLRQSRAGVRKNSCGAPLPHFLAMPLGKDI